MQSNILTQWTPKQFKTVQKAVVKYLNSRYFETHHSKDRTPFVGCKTFAQYDSILGLAYTSTGIYAGYWVCNTNLYLDSSQNWVIEGFILDKNSFVYLMCWDKYENEILIPIN